MNPPKCTRNDFINFLIAAFQICSCTEASRCLQSDSEPIAHDSVKRLLERQSHHTEALYNESKQMIQQNEGVLVIDDSTLDKPYSRQMELVTRHWSGKHHRVVQGINLVSMIWTDGTAIVPVDYRIYNPETDGKTKNDHFREMVKAAKDRHFHPQCVVFDTWYASIENLKLIHSFEWHWFTRLKSNRLVNPDHTINRQISEIEIPPEGRVVHLRQYRLIKVFKVVHGDNDVEYWATDVLDVRNWTENHSKTLDGISKSIIGELSSVVELRSVRVGKKWCKGCIFSLHCSHFSD